jgi:hypothetical protein
VANLFRRSYRLDGGVGNGTANNGDDDVAVAKVLEVAASLYFGRQRQRPQSADQSTVGGGGSGGGGGVGGGHLLFAAGAWPDKDHLSGAVCGPDAGGRVGQGVLAEFACGPRL